MVLAGFCASVSCGRSAMRRLIRGLPQGSAATAWPRLALALFFIVVPAAFAGSVRSSATPPVLGIWRRLPPAPIAPSSSVVSVWTGRQMLIFGRAQPNPPWSGDVAASYTPATRTWRRLAPYPGPTGNYEGRYWAVWTGKEMVVSGPFDFQAYNPITNRWRRLRETAAPPGGLVVWTGREMIGWGGGCCGDAWSEGAAYNPTTSTRRMLARSPLAPDQAPIGAWTGRELVVLVSGIKPADTKPWPARLARAAAYNPVTDTWRRIDPLPAARSNANAVWDGREVLIVGGTGVAHAGRAPTPAAIGFAYDPATNSWRRLPSMGAGRVRAAAAWTGRRLLIWGGTTSSPASLRLTTPTRGLAYDPMSNCWSSLPRAPLSGRLDPAAVWTGNALIVWGGQRPASPPGSGTRSFADGAAFNPARR
jgi:hypothetical protein